MSRDYSSYPPLRIIAYSDFYDIPEPKVWGDYWLKEHLLREFRKVGYPLSDSRPAVVLHLFGEPLSATPPAPIRIAWIHSHPDWATPERLAHYHKILCISPQFTEALRERGLDAEFLMIPTGMTPVVREKRHDIVFVGNTKQGRMRTIIQELGAPSCRVKIWGWGWKGLIPDEWYGGEYFDNGSLHELYASSRIVLNDTHPDMRREGFLNPRVLDVLASGGFVISDPVLGMERLLGSSVPSYATPEELGDMIEQYLGDHSARERCTHEGLARISGWTYAAAAAEIIRQIELISATLSL